MKQVTLRYRCRRCDQHFDKTPGLTIGQIRPAMDSIIYGYDTLHPVPNELERHECTDHDIGIAELVGYSIVEITDDTTGSFHSKLSLVE